MDIHKTILCLWEINNIWWMVMAQNGISKSIWRGLTWPQWCWWWGCWRPRWGRGGACRGAPCGHTRRGWGHSPAVMLSAEILVIVFHSGGNGSGYESIINDKHDNMTGPDTSCEHSCNKLKNIGIKMSQSIVLLSTLSPIYITSNIELLNIYLSMYPLSKCIQ